MSTGFVPVVLVGIVLSFSIVLGFALITESGGWTVVLIVALLFVSSNVVTELIPDTPAVRSAIRSIDSRGSAFQIALGVEVLLIVSIGAAGCLDPPQGEQPLHAAARHGNDDALRAAIEAGAPLDERGFDDTTALARSRSGSSSTRWLSAARCARTGCWSARVSV